MPRTDALTDPMVSTVACVLAVPLRELYALLWRAGVVEVLTPDQEPRPAPPTAASARGPNRADPGLRTTGPQRPQLRSPQRRLLGPEPIRGD
ncbi:MAG: Rv1535 domain-containing protein, partial [Mycobacterium sp.]